MSAERIQKAAEAFARLGIGSLSSLAAATLRQAGDFEIMERHYEAIGQTAHLQRLLRLRICTAYSLNRLRLMSEREVGEVERNGITNWDNLRRISGVSRWYE